MNYSKASWAVLAAVRFVLALLVFDIHVWLVGLPSIVQRFLPLSAGHVAVLGFLLISGVAIGCSFRERADGFYTRRFLRIYPLYFAAIAFTQGVVLAVPSMVAFPSLSIHPAGPLTTVANLLFLQGIAAIPLPYDRPLWSLSLEAWLYSLTPLLFRMPRRGLLALVAASMFLFSFQGGARFDSLPGLYLFKWAWAWMVGLLLARDQRKAPAVLLGAIGAGLFLFNTELASGGPANVTLFAVTLAIVFGADRAALSGPIRKTANFLGDLSYPLYLFHIPMMILLYSRFGVRSELRFVAAILAFVMVLNRWYEQKLKRVFWIPLAHSITQRLPLKWSLLRARA